MATYAGHGCHAAMKICFKSAVMVSERGRIMSDDGTMYPRVKTNGRAFSTARGALIVSKVGFRAVPDVMS